MIVFRTHGQLASTHRFGDAVATPPDCRQCQRVPSTVAPSVKDTDPDAAAGYPDTSLIRSS